MNNRKERIEAFSNEQREKGDYKYSKVSLDVREDINKRLNDLAKIYPRGFKTDCVNLGLELIVEELEELNSEELEEYKRKNKPESN